MCALSRSRQRNAVKHPRCFILKSEFALIKRYFDRPPPKGFDGVGDDCALLPIPAGQHLATTTDMLLEGRHFLSGADPARLGHKALAVNLSDLAAMGAQPLGCLLGLALPSVDHTWLSHFSEGFHALAAQSGCPLVGGDTTRSTSGIVISVTAMGHVDRSLALRRSAAQVGDDIWVSGFLGAADVALDLIEGRLPADADLLAATRTALEMPRPPLRFAPQLCGVAHAALDISDGLAQDLGHILKASQCGADLQYELMPIDPALATLHPDRQRKAVLSGGDVYQLCFTAPPDRHSQIKKLARAADVRVTQVGRITAEPGLRIYDGQGQLIHLESGGFDHFSGS